MNVQKRKIFGKLILIQDEELKVEPSYRQIRGFIKEPSWCFKNKCLIFGLFLILCVIGSLGIVLGIYFTDIISCKNIQCQNDSKCMLRDNHEYDCECKNGYSGKYCELYNACWNHSCGVGDICKPKSLNSHDYKCLCKSKYLDSVCKSDSYGELTLMAGGDDGQLASLDTKNRIRVWKDSSLKSSQILKYNWSESIKSITFLQNDLLAVGSTKIEIWNLTNESVISTLSKSATNVNALLTVHIMNKTYLLSGSDDSKIRVWDENFNNLKTLSNHNRPITALTYSSNVQMIASSSAKENKIHFWLLPFKLEAEKTNSEASVTGTTIRVLNNGLIVAGSTSLRGGFRVWKKAENESSLQLVANVSWPLYRNVSALIVLKNNSLVSGSWRTIKIWNQINDTWFECINTITDNLNQSITSFALYDDSLLIGGDGLGSILIWNQTTFSLLSVIENAHSNRVLSIIILNNGNLATGSSDFTVKIWSKNVNVTSFELFKKLDGHSDQVRGLAVLPNDLFASASRDRTIKIWNQLTWECIKILNDNPQSLRTLAVLGNGYFVAVYESDTAIIWDSRSFARLATLRTNDSKLISVFPYSKSSFILGDTKETIQIWDTQSFDVSYLKSLKTKDVLSLVFFKVNYFLTGHSDGVINVWTIDSNRQYDTLRQHSSGVTCLASVDYERFASGSVDKTIRVYDSSFKNISVLSHHLGRINALTFLSGKYLISTSNDASLMIYKTKGIQTVNTFAPHSEAVQEFAILDEKSELFATCSLDNEIKIWNNSKLIANLTGHNDYVYSLEYSSINKLLISSSRDRSIKLWNISNYTLINTVYGHRDSVVSLLVLETKLYSGSCDYNITIWNLTSFDAIKTLDHHRGCVNALAVLKNKYLLSGSTDTLILVWDIDNDHNLINKLRDHDGPVTSLSILGNKVASASADKTIKIWSLESYVLKANSTVITSKIDSMCALSDGRIASGHDDGEIIIWNVKKETSLQLITKLKAHTKKINALILLKNNSLVSCSADETIKIWKNVNNSFECIKTLNDHKSSVESLAIYENALLIGGDEQGKIYIWNQTSLNLIQKIGLKEETNKIVSIVVLNNGNLVSSGKKVTIWGKVNKTSFNFLQTLKDHQNSITSLAVLPNNLFAGSSNDFSIRIWNQTSLKQVRILKEHTRTVSKTVSLGNGHFLSMAILDRSAIVWDSYSFEKIAVIENASFASVFAYLDNSFIAVKNVQNEEVMIQIWSPEFSNNAKTLTGHNDTVTDLVVLNAGYLVSASFDGTIRIWDNSFSSIVTQQHGYSDGYLALKVFTNGSLISSSLDGLCTVWETDHYILNKTIYKDN